MRVLLGGRGGGNEGVVGGGGVVGVRVVFCGGDKGDKKGRSKMLSGFIGVLTSGQRSRRRAMLEMV